ncbi:MAG: hypothetical protein ABJM86_01285 [Hyphomicrobiales bacterium]
MFIAHSKSLFTSALFAALLISAQMAAAQTHFTLSEIDNGYILLNKETSALSVCTKFGDELVCDPASREQPSAQQEQLDTSKPQVKTLAYYFNKVFSADFQANSSTFFANVTKRLFDMVDEIKAAYKATNA